MKKLEVYNNLIQLLKEIKLTQGAAALNSTLLRHKIVRQFLFDFQKSRIVDLEESIL